MIELKEPKKFSQAMRMALKDLAKVEKDPKYRVDMGAWHLANAYPNHKCAVCFAGSVMAKSFKLSPDEEASFTSFQGKWPSIFIALNRVRRGDVSGALRIFSGAITDKFTTVVPTVNYEKDPKLWRKQMFAIVRKLEAVKL